MPLRFDPETGNYVPALSEEGSRSVPLQTSRVTVSTTPVNLPSPPPGATRAVIRNLGQPINWRDDGTDPTGTTGMTALANEVFVYDGDCQAMRLVRSSSATGDADLRVAYYSD